MVSLKEFQYVESLCPPAYADRGYANFAYFYGRQALTHDLYSHPEHHVLPIAQLVAVISPEQYLARFLQADFYGSYSIGRFLAYIRGHHYSWYLHFMGYLETIADKLAPGFWVDLWQYLPVPATVDHFPAEFWKISADFRKATEGRRTQLLPEETMQALLAKGIPYHEILLAYQPEALRAPN